MNVKLYLQVVMLGIALLKNESLLSVHACRMC